MNIELTPREAELAVAAIKDTAATFNQNGMKAITSMVKATMLKQADELLTLANKIERDANATG